MRVVVSVNLSDIFLQYSMSWYGIQSVFVKIYNGLWGFGGLHNNYICNCVFFFSNTVEITEEIRYNI